MVGHTCKRYKHFRKIMDPNPNCTRKYAEKLKIAGTLKVRLKPIFARINGGNCIIAHCKDLVPKNETVLLRLCENFQTYFSKTPLSMKNAEGWQ